MKVIALFGDDPNQRALAQRLHATVPIFHIARIRRPAPVRSGRLLRSVTSLILARSLRTAWRAVMRHYDNRFPVWPSCGSSVHASANAPELIDLVVREQPDLVLVSGTDLLRKATLERLPAKIMNLHTGISPFIKGGPNCTNWALALGEFDMIGNTVMWIDAGIDTGAIVTTERTPLTGRETLAALHIKVMEHAHDLFRRALEHFASGKVLPAVPQGEIGEGRLFYSRDWDSVAMVRAAFNHRFRYRPFAKRDIPLVALDLAS